MAVNLPKVEPEKIRSYAKGSPERAQLLSVLDQFRTHTTRTIGDWLSLKHGNIAVPSLVEGSAIRILNPAKHVDTLAIVHPTTEDTATEMLEHALVAVKDPWAELSFQHKAAVFLRAADLIAAKYRYKLMAALIIGQGMDIRQAEVDVADTIDYLRFNVHSANDLLARQPRHNAPGIWNTSEYTELEGFVFVCSSPHSIAEAVNQLSAASLMGNVVLWALAAAASIWGNIVMQVFEEAGLPNGVVQFIPAATPATVQELVANPALASLVYSGNFTSFASLQLVIATNLMKHTYNTLPSVIVDIEGSSLHVIHPACDVPKAVSSTTRAALEYQGQRKGSISSAYVPLSIWDAFKTQIVAAFEGLGVGATENIGKFIGPVIDRESFEALLKIIKSAREDEDLELVTGGGCADSDGYFIQPTIFATHNIEHSILNPKEPLKGPVLIVCIYDDQKVPIAEAWLNVCRHIRVTAYSCRAASIFAKSRHDIQIASNILKSIVGNLGINTRCNAAATEQQPWGGGRLGGTGEKGGSESFVAMFATTCSVREELLGGYHVIYACHVE
ncbi:mitochondrial delta-1-pyrroline-5-carboxylate dehydrogenase [Xylariales sp. PMI_506]|nr:mitochondrial delta-1-pyrroline-5-carboxylate dehydrogenase [Xylariales sp. PMI_506]